MPQPVHLVTGATSGIGRVAAQALAATGARVIIVARDPARGRRTVDEIRAATHHDDVELAIADLSSLAQVRALAAEVADRCDHLDLLVNNAGLVMAERRSTVDGREWTIAVNHLAPFLLTNLLRERLEAAASPRVVTTASVAERGGRLDLDDLDFERRRFRPFRAYCQSKLANLLFTAELARRWGGSVHATCVHPGGVATNFGAEGPWLLRQGMRRAGRLVLRTPEEGADTLIWAAVSGEAGPGAVPNGSFLADRSVKQPSRAGRDPELARRLWDVSARLVGLAPMGC